LLEKLVSGKAGAIHLAIQEKLEAWRKASVPTEM
jgi:hypothetical protein